MRISWLMRLSSAATIVTPWPCMTRPTKFLVLRSNTSTILPSGLPFLSSPLMRTMARSPCITCAISRGPKNTSSACLVLSSGTKKPKPSGWPITLPAMACIFSAKHNAPFRLRIIWPSRSMALRRLLKLSRSSALISNKV